MATEQFTFDAVGNRSGSEGQAPSTGRSTDYTYDFENRLIEVDYSGMVAQYQYDPFGRRIEKNVNNVITRYVYDGPNIVTQYDGAGNVTAKYTHTLDIDDPLTVQQGANTYYYHKDGLGSVVNLTDNAGNNIKGYTYKSFGEIYSEAGSLVQPFTFTGREYDPESGLYYYRSRYYDPRAGRFLTKDPVGFAGGDVNLDRYVANNPVNRIDPLGLMWSGAGVTVLGQLFSGGGTGGLYRIKNWSTGEQCIIAVYGGGLGGGLGASLNAEGIWIWNAPTSSDLGGTVNAVVVYGGVGTTGVGGGYGKGGCSKDVISNKDLPIPSNSSSVNLGAGFGAGYGYIIGSFTTKVLLCW